MKWIGLTVLGMCGVVVVTVIGLLLMGRRASAGQLRGEVVINRPGDTVFAWITEPDKLTQWVGGLVEVRPETPGPKAVGSRESWVMQDPIRRQGMTLLSEVTALAPNRRIAARLSLPGSFSGVGSYTVTPLENGSTRLEADSRFTYDRWFFRLLEPLISAQATKKLQTDFGHLKEKLEAGH
ncbi:MAG: SRPBCC family protein [Gemmatimonadales bacterium]